jgi:YidC/Oxa1 family membrane protein insertase
VILPLADILKPLEDGAESILDFFHNDVGFTWAVSIIALTVVIRTALIPLTYKQIKGMRALQALQPQMKEIQEKFKNDRQRQQQELMRFYRENKVNPFASCLPLLLQLPFFIALFYMLRTDLREDICGQTAKACGDVVAGSAEFLFIPDLTAAATGATLVVLILLYVSSQLASGLLSTATMDKNQRMLMLALPVVFVAFIINFPAGLIVYWITTNMWTIVQQLIVRKTVGPIRRPEPVGAAALAGGPAKGASKAKAKPSANGASAGGPPPSARKKKKRTGRRR